MSWALELQIDDYEQQVQRAIGFFWEKRRASWQAKNKMDGFAEIVQNIVKEYGADLQLRVLAGSPSIPSIFRPSKSWDIVVTDSLSRIVAAIELKSHVGSGNDTSFEQNFNNRVEEALGTAMDFHTSMPYLTPYIAKPFVGFLLLLEDHPNSRLKKRVSTHNLAIQDSAIWTRFFHNKTMIQRWERCFESLVNARVYDACGLVLCEKDKSQRTEGVIQERFTDRYFFRALAAHLASTPPTHAENAES